MSPLSDTVKSLIADALSVPAADVTSATGLATTPAWDSLAHMRLVLALEDRLGRQLTPNEIISIASAEDVAALVR
ncbi:MAG: acyl carrier protein [Pseudomonadota bacterium]